jgi:hypothetical protein
MELSPVPSPSMGEGQGVGDIDARASNHAPS